MGNISRSFYNDLRSARQAQRQAAKPVVVEQLTRKGVPSKMPDATQYFDTVAEAQEYVARLRKLNPTLNLQFRISER